MDNNLPDKPNRREKFISNLLQGMTITEAGINAGYSESYSRTSLHTLVKHDPKIRSEIQSKINQVYNEFAKSRLIDIAQIEADIIEACKQDINQVPKHRQTLKEIKQASGVLQQDNQPTTIINIKDIRAIINQQLTDDNTIQAEVIEDTTLDNSQD